VDPLSKKVKELSAPSGFTTKVANKRSKKKVLCLKRLCMLREYCDVGEHSAGAAEDTEAAAEAAAMEIFEAAAEEVAEKEVVEEDADAAMARAMAAEDAVRAEQQVRAADARRVESMMGGGGMMGGGMGGSYDGVGGVGGLLSGGSAAFFSGGGAYDARAAGTVDSATWTLDEDAPEGSASERKDKNLSDMFAAPKELMFHGPFQAARQAGKDSKRWLLVNIQSDADFACHALNRDVWGDEMVQSLVESGFVFWQQDKDKSDEARTYVERCVGANASERTRASERERATRPSESRRRAGAAEAGYRGGWSSAGEAGKLGGWRGRDRAQRRSVLLRRKRAALLGGCRGETPRTPPAAGELARAPGRTCGARPHMRSVAPAPPPN
jgi:hypothetical protein